MTVQEKEIQTIRPRTLQISLSDADVRRIIEKAGAVGLSVSELLENFIADLVDGTYSNGSDERMHADEWFTRCWFSCFQEYEDSFLRHLLTWGDVYGALDCWDAIQECRDDLACEEQAGDAESIAAIKEEMEYQEQNLREMYEEFLDTCRDRETMRLDAEMEKIIAWRNANSSLQQEGG